MILSVAVFYLIPSVQKCLHDFRCNHPGYNDQHQHSALVIALAPYVGCYFSFFDAHNGAVSAIMAIFVAVLTIALTRSSNQQARASEDQALSSATSAKAAVDAVESAADIAKRQSRAHLGFREGGKGFTIQDEKSSNKFYFSGRLKNYGPTPAHDVNVRCTAAILEFPLKSDPHSVHPPQVLPPSQMVIAPGQEIECHALASKFYAEELVAECRQPNIPGTNHRAYVICEAYYTDVFGDQFRVTACWYINFGTTDATWMYASRGNSVEQIEPQKGDDDDNPA